MHDGDREIRLHLIAMANVALARLKGKPSTAIEAHAEDGNTELMILATPVGRDGPLFKPTDASSIPLRPFFFSPLERQVLEAVATTGPVKGATIAARVGQVDRGSNGASSKLRTLLGNLVERNVLAIQDDGYDVADEFRHLLAVVLPPTLGKS